MENITLLAQPYTAIFGSDAKPGSASTLSPQECLDKVKKESEAFAKAQSRDPHPRSAATTEASQRQTLYDGIRNMCLQRLALEHEFDVLHRQGAAAAHHPPAAKPAGPGAADSSITVLYGLEVDNYKLRRSLSSADELLKKNAAQLLALQKQLLADQEALPASSPAHVATDSAATEASLRADLAANQALFRIRLHEFLKEAQQQARNKIKANDIALAALRPRVTFDEGMLQGILQSQRDRSTQRPSLPGRGAHQRSSDRPSPPDAIVSTLFWNQLLNQFQADLDNKNQQVWQWRYDLYNATERSPEVIGRRLQAQANDLQAINLTVNSLMDGALSRRQGDASVAGPSAPPAIDTGLLDQLVNTLSQVNETEQNMSILRDEITFALEQVNPAKRWFDHLLLQAESALRLFWEFNLFTLKEQLNVNGQDVVTTQNITVGKSLGAILVLVVGYLVGAWLLKLLRQLAIRSLGVSERVANRAYKAALVVMVATLVVFSLNLVHVPLSVFTLFGGVLAVGLGFGAQSLVKNLIGALILQLTHPARVGDYIVVNQHAGFIKTMGWQFCVVRGFDGDESIISNMEMLSGSLINWTYQDKNMRRTVTVGVAYGSPVQQVIDLLLAVAAATPEALQDPAPMVYFNEFGDSSLTFQLKYWIRLDNASPAIIDSEVRHRINDALNAAGIVMAFPQRDLHVYQDQPFKVDLVSPRRAA
ncbi:mechanosensitive ion channel [Curvibacter sp. RS43]|uniref:mechanosensitive ion channel family protein n=1 Tax=Curvibacter microcysteis TaxID=3026419 RepID=UPI00235E3C4D|nr:mechanosensitive ion channel domain-containing protein [Curvibacter sp. RS43]MDD0812376.1 mechanosensitive ion channel [Curvibacter sp. RS43]